MKGTGLRVSCERSPRTWEPLKFRGLEGVPTRVGTDPLIDQREAFAEANMALKYNNWVTVLNPILEAILSKNLSNELFWLSVDLPKVTRLKTKKKIPLR